MSHKDRVPRKRSGRSVRPGHQEGRLAIMTAADPREQIEIARASGIRFVQLQFTDIIGSVKAVTIPNHQLGTSVTHGTCFDG